MQRLLSILAILLAAGMAYSQDEPALTDAEATETPVTEVVDEVAEQLDAALESDLASELAEDIPLATEPVERRGYYVEDAGEQETAILGSLDQKSGYKIYAGLNAYGASLHSVSLTDYFNTVKQEENYTILSPVSTPSYLAYAYAVQYVTINDTRVGLAGVRWELVNHEPGKAVYRVLIRDEEDKPAVEIRRLYTLETDSYDLRLAQRVFNHTDEPLKVSLTQHAQGDLTPDEASYLGDRRQFVLGYARPGHDPQRSTVYTGDGFIARDKIVKKQALWPQPSLDADSELTWVAVENRYFVVATHPWVTQQMIDAGVHSMTEVPDLQDLFPRIEPIVRFGPTGQPTDAAVMLSMTTATQTLDPRASFTTDLGIFTGPRKKDVFVQEPYAAMDFMDLIRYELGCTWCTFQWLAHLLLGYMKIIHAVCFDWGLAIIVLVVTVRLLLHPLTKRAQTNMMKMSKQMSALQPEMAKLKKKYANDKQQLNSEMMKLYREKGVNPANVLGCLPLFLQMPIWVALYAMLYFAIELRHEPAFYGVFQMFGGWEFLADLSVSDRFIPLFEPSQDAILRLPLITLDYSAINILPFVMAIVMFVNMKFTTPPPPENESEEQRKMRRQQQMIMKIMPFMFPILLYSAPSGLTLYICASTAAGILDSYLVRKHVRELEASGKLFEKKERKSGGFMDRLQKAAEARQQMMADAQKQRATQKRKKR